MDDREELAIRLLREDEGRLIHQMVREFSTCEPFQHSVCRQMAAISRYLGTWLEADSVVHFFTNPVVPEVHYLHTNLSSDTEDGYCRLDLRIDPAVEPMVMPSDQHELCGRLGLTGGQCLYIPFEQHDYPFGHFLLFFRGDLPSDTLQQKVRSSLNVLQNCLKDLWYNHFPITRYTYLPSFQTQRSTEAAILFCDIRNSTSLSETSGDYVQSSLVAALIKSVLEYASLVISVSTVGRIHKFMGDGFLATFGEYLVLESPERKARVACSLALLSARLLVEGFGELWKCVVEHPGVVDYLRRANNSSDFCDVEVAFGVGVNYARVWFDLFGISVAQAEYGRTPRGFFEYTAIGSGMNYTQRLCSTASKPREDVGMTVCCRRGAGSVLTAPIIVSKSAVGWIEGCLHCTNRSELVALHESKFRHKGFQGGMPAYEFWEEDIDPRLLLICLQGVHDNRFHNALATEYGMLGSSPARPALRSVIERLKVDLDTILAGGQPGQGR